MRERGLWRKLEPDKPQRPKLEWSDSHGIREQLLHHDPPRSAVGAPSVIPLRERERQLFVDDFVLETSSESIRRRWYRPQLLSASPLVEPAESICDREIRLSKPSEPQPQLCPKGILYDAPATAAKMSGSRRVCGRRFPQGCCACSPLPPASRSAESHTNFLTLEVGEPTAHAYPGGLIYQRHRERWLLFYQSSLGMTLSVATSTDLVHWEKEEGSRFERPCPEDEVAWHTLADKRASTRFQRERYSAAETIRRRCIRSDSQVVASADEGRTFVLMAKTWRRDAEVFVSRDEEARKWELVGTTGPLDDRSTLWYNPWRQMWVFGLRYDWFGCMRVYRYWEASPPLTQRSISWHWDMPRCYAQGMLERWGGARCRADHRPLRPCLRHSSTCPRGAKDAESETEADLAASTPVPWIFTTRRDQQLYPNVNATLVATERDEVPVCMNERLTDIYGAEVVVYESLFVGLFGLWQGGQRNHLKRTRVHVGFSRDGFHFDRPAAANPFVTEHAVPPERRDLRLPGAARADLARLSKFSNLSVFRNIQPVGGGVASAGDRTYILTTGRTQRLYGTFAHVLRRDGFCAMALRPGRRRGELVTRPLRLPAGARSLHVNADLSGGSLRAELLRPEDGDAASSPGGTLAGVNSTDATVWKLTEGPERIARIRFELTRTGEASAGRVELFSFWVE